MDQARKGRAFLPWSEILGLMALRLIAGDPTGPDRWAEVANVVTSGSLAWLVQSFSGKIEASNRELTDVFTRGLLPSLERFDAKLMGQWLFTLWQVSTTSISPAVFGAWLNDKVAEIAMRSRDSDQIGTPLSVARLMAELLDVGDNASILDPCCGSGAILADAVDQARLRQRQIKTFGQEASLVNWALCKLGLFFLGQDTTSIILGDCLRHPAFAEGPRLRQFDRVSCNAPIGLSLRDAGLANEDPYQRFVFASPGRGSADSAFVQHAFASMKPDGRAVLLLSNGFLFRSGVDGRVRDGLVKSDVVQAVIGLPAKLLPQTAIETVLLVLGRNESGQILFIDASKLQPVARGKAELSEETIQRIMEIVHSRQPATTFSRLVSVEDLTGESDLHPRRYISQPTEQQPKITTAELLAELRSLEARAHDTAEQMDALLRELPELGIGPV